MVSLSVVIDDQGQVTQADIKKCEVPELGELAIAAIKRWKFKPAVLGGLPVHYRVLIPIRFE